MALVSRFVLGERLTSTQMVGFALLAVTIVLITQQPRTAESDVRPQTGVGRPAVERSSPIVGVSEPRSGSSAPDPA